MVKLNYMQCWNDAMKILREHKEAVLAIAGVFLFLPSLLFAQFVGEPPLDGTEDLNALIEITSNFWQENTFAMLLSNLMMSFGGFAIYVIITSTSGSTVGQSLSVAIKLFLFFFLANIMAGFLTIGGLLLFIVPGLYIASRLALIPAVIADRHERSSVQALKQSWDITKGNGFSILLFVLIVLVIGSIFLGAVQLLVGIGLGLVTGGEGWPLITNLVSTLMNTALAVLLLAIIVSIYRQLTGAVSTPADLTS